jgi:hypothetical protein
MVTSLFFFVLRQEISREALQDSIVSDWVPTGIVPLFGPAV